VLPSKENHEILTFFFFYKILKKCMSYLHNCRVNPKEDGDRKNPDWIEKKDERREEGVAAGPLLVVVDEDVVQGHRAQHESLKGAVQPAETKYFDIQVAGNEPFLQCG
jgi:hypothetical protein